MPLVTFVCSANFYRSRFAEYLFNHLASEMGTAWHADSRGLRVGHWGDVGALSHFTVDGLRARGVPVEDNPRYPQQLALTDLVHSNLVVAVKEVEHRAMMEELFPDWVDAVEYWDVDDIDCAPPDEALAYLEQRVRSLILRLQQEDVAGRKDVA